VTLLSISGGTEKSHNNSNPTGSLSDDDDPILSSQFRRQHYVEHIAGETSDDSNDSDVFSSSQQILKFTKTRQSGRGSASLRAHHNQLADDLTEYWLPKAKKRVPKRGLKYKQ